MGRAARVVEHGQRPAIGLWRVIEYDRNHGAKYSGLLQVWGLGLHDPE
jgi:hypothetical protein